MTSNIHMHRKFFWTPGGHELSIEVREPAPISGRDAKGVVVSVSVSGGTRVIGVDIPNWISLDGISLASDPDAEVDQTPIVTLAVLAVIDHIDSSPDESNDVTEAFIDINEALAERLIHKSPTSDRELRRFIARWAYTVFCNGTLSARLTHRRLDQLITGCSATAFERNIGLLVEEGYLVRTTEPRRATIVHRTVNPTARLVREVERYGCAKDDAVSETDYAASIRAYPILAPVASRVLSEWQRFGIARSAAELISVFRALAPDVEAVIGDVLKSHGSTRSTDTLGPMIGDLQQRKLADRGMVSKLNHVLVFTRDLALHGASMSEPVLRIACETAFEVLPQLAALSKS